MNHGIYRRKAYQLWYNMRTRCLKESSAYYKNYGGAGVTICDTWNVFENFINDVRNIKGFDMDKFIGGELTLDKDIDGGKVYSTLTCEFISREDNNRIKPNQQKKFVGVSPDGICYDGISQSEFSRTHDVPQSGISACLLGRKGQYKGWKFSYY